MSLPWDEKNQMFISIDGSLHYRLFIIIVCRALPLPLPLSLYNTNEKQFARVIKAA